jgi:hypothetical protein
LPTPPSSILLCSWLLGACSGKDDTDTDESSNLSGSWSGACEIAGGASTSILDMDIDAKGNVAGTVSNADGTSGELSGVFHDPELSVTCRYADGTVSEITGDVTSTGTNGYAGNLTIQMESTLLEATCTFTKDAAPELSPATAAAGAAAEALCSRTAECSNTPLSSSEATLCRTVFQGTLQLVPDPSAFATCIEALDCARLSDAASVQTCLALDNETVRCDDEVLHGCSNSGKCTEIDCATACHWLALSFDHCGFDAAKTHDVCFCA